MPTEEKASIQEDVYKSVKSGKSATVKGNESTEGTHLPTKSKLVHKSKKSKSNDSDTETRGEKDSIDAGTVKRTKKQKIKAVEGGIRDSDARPSSKDESSNQVDESSNSQPKVSKKSLEMDSDSAQDPVHASNDKTESTIQLENSHNSSFDPAHHLWDLECALHHVLDSMSPIEGEREYVTKDKDVWITFRLAHAGDVSEVARLYRREQSQTKNHAKEDDKEDADGTTTSLEVRLAEGLGDEDHPPVAFCVLGFLHSEKEDEDKDNSDAKESDSTSTAPNTPCQEGHLAAAALLTEELTVRLDDMNDSSSRKLPEQHSFTNCLIRVEWIHVIRTFENGPSSPKDLAKSIRSHLWLRLASVGVLTKSPIRLVE